MEFYIDSGDLGAIKIAAATGLVNGVTTNPTLIAKSSDAKSLTFEQQLKKICIILRKHSKTFTVSAEVPAGDAKSMVKEGTRLAKLDPNIIVKVPMNEQGLITVQSLAKLKIRCNVTLIFSANQALLAANAGAFIVSPFMGRLDDAGSDSTELIEEIREIYDNFHIRTKILAASIRTPRHVTEAALAGADISTVPPNIFTKLFKHSLTDKGLEQFESDWQQYKETHR